MKLEELSPTTTKVIFYFLAILLIAATGSALYFWYKEPPSTNTVEYVKVPEIREVIKIKRVEVPGPERIVTIEKQTIIEKLGLPEWIRTNADEQAIATASIEPYRGKTNAVALLNTRTGVGQILAKQEPLPLLGFLNEREIGVRAGVNIKAEPITSVYGKYDFARIGNVQIGVYGDANSDGTAKIQVGVGLKF
jgi:hypothetical protein